jgi:hypothetical protein
MPVSFLAEPGGAQAEQNQNDAHDPVNRRRRLRQGLAIANAARSH